LNLRGVTYTFPGAGTGAKGGANWTIPDSHTSEVVKLRSASNSVLIRRTLDYDTYLVRVSFEDGYELRRIGPHAFVVATPMEAAADEDDDDVDDHATPPPLWVSVSFAPASEYGTETGLSAPFYSCYKRSFYQDRLGTNISS
jgi:hypothetical protein